MFKKKPLAAAIGSFAAASALTVAPTAFAQEDAALVADEEVIVVGSRIPTQVSDAPRPVSIIDRNDIELSGLESVAEVLRNTAYNTFGSFREQSGSTFGQIALVNLRGLGEDRTAVLINGRRVPGNPLTGSAAVDLNAIPLAAVERIELLTDSASAIYGADAIGGVVNIIMRDDYDGAEFEIGAERPSDKGADADHFSFSFGTSSDKGSILFAGEWFKKDPIFDADRDYSRAAISPNPSGGLPRHAVDTVGISSGGNTIFELDFTDAFAIGPAGIGDCPTDVYVPLSDPEGVTGSEGCGFGYADLSMQTGGIDRKSTFLTANYEIAPGHQAYVENRFTTAETFGRYAPAVGFFLVSEDASLNPTNPAFVGTVPDDIGEQRDVFLFHRFIGHGNRDDRVETNEIDIVAGLSGSLADDRVNYDAYARYYEYNSQEEGDTYVIASIIEDLVANDAYNFINPTDPANASAIAQSSATLLRDIKTEFTGAGITFDGFFFDLPAGQVGWAVGGEIGTEDYQDQYDSFREASNVLGSAGNTSQGSRSRHAIFGEASIPLLETLELGLAARFDHYSDFGNETSPQVSLRFQPIDQIVIRASYGEGFAAPSLGALYQELAFSANTVQDRVRCDAQGLADCPDSQIEEYTGGNPELQAEKSESFNIGAVIEPFEDFTLSVDYYQIEVDEAVNTLSVQDVITFEQRGQLPPGVIVNRAPTQNGIPGIITRCEGSPLSPPDCGMINVYANLAALEVEGLDVRAHWDIDTDGLGSFAADLEWAHVLNLEETPLPGGATLQREGTACSEAKCGPENRVNLNVRWSYDQFTVNYTWRWMDEMEAFGGGGKYDEHSTHDITAVWYAPWNGELTVGVRNLTDEEAQVDDVAGYDNEISLYYYDVAGRVPFVSYKHSF